MSIPFHLLGRWREIHSGEWFTITPWTADMSYAQRDGWGRIELLERDGARFKIRIFDRIRRDGSTPGPLTGWLEFSSRNAFSWGKREYVWWNVFALYGDEEDEADSKRENESGLLEELLELIEAHRALPAEARPEGIDWAALKEIAEPWRDVGATDTASVEQMAEYFQLAVRDLAPR